jgi:hypothetical protein
MLPIYEATVNTGRESSPQPDDFSDEKPARWAASSGLGLWMR